MCYIFLLEEQICLYNIKEMASVNRDNNPKTIKRLKDQIIKLSDYFIRHPYILCSTYMPIAFFITVLIFNKKIKV
jgi:hypothetical protein